MTKAYQPWTQDQLFLLPPSMSEWLAEDHLAWLVLDVVSQLDLGEIERAIQGKDARGQRPYHPAMMVSLLVYAYCTGVYSSRRIARACREDVAFRVVSGNAQPYFTNINEFRKVHGNAFAKLFVEVLQLCREAGLVKLRHVAIDGTKVKANASKHKAMSYKRMCEAEERLQTQVNELMAAADAADQAEDARFGEGRTGEEVPEELRRRESRLARIREAKQALEAQARSSRAEALRAQAEGMEQSAAQDDRPSMRKRLRTKAAVQRRKADALVPPDDDEPPGGNGTGELPLKRTLAKPDATPVDGAQRNFTDPESHLMMGPDGFIQGWNAQLAVDDTSQVIVALGITDQPSDAANLAPMLERVVANLGESPEHVTADSGYWRPGVEAAAEVLGSQAWVATGRVRHGEAGPARRNGEPPAHLDERERMRWRLDTAEGRALYAQRKAVVEPVNGHIKHARGFTRFSLRGRAGVESEWNLVAVAHNLLKLFTHRAEASTA